MQTQLKAKESQLEPVHPYSRTYDRVSIKTILLSPDGGKSMVRRAE